jgi:hypothetical protein
MATNSEILDHLNEQQVMMLRLLKNPLPNDDFLQMRKLAVKLLSKKMDNLIEDHETKNNISEETYDKLKDAHFRSKS